MSPPCSRSATALQLAQTPLDVLVIGGGIVGCGIARDAALRGLKVGLLEQHDFAFGTSSRSSRLLHGGLRYLAQGRVGLVHEASREKTIIHHIAPHLAEPLPFLFPTYRRDPDWKLWQLKIGVKIYDLLCHGRNLGQSTWLRASEVVARLPSLPVKHLSGAVRYFDGFTNDARLVLDTLRSAAKAGAHVLNYCEFLQAKPGDFWTCTARDGMEDVPLNIRTRTVVNAAGSWAPNLAQSQVKLRLTKGVHLVVARTRLPLEEALVMTEGPRILFAIPWGERTILGTTDTDWHGPLDDVTAEPEDVAYVLRVTDRYFPASALRPEDVLSTWAGLRPLIAKANGAPSEISRSHQIRSPQPGWWDVAGGKLTTYRLMAEQAVDRLSKSLPQKPCAPSRTSQEPLLAADEVNGYSGIVPPEVSLEAVRHYCDEEWALHLTDVMLRRSSWHYYLPDAATQAEKVATYMAQTLSWSEERRAAEVQRYRTAPSAPHLVE